MKSSVSIFLTILGAWTVPTLASFPIVKDGMPHYVACGGVLNEPVAAITYKADVSISPNERCVWTIRSTETVSYTLNVLSFGLQTEPGDTGVTATCLSKPVSNTYDRTTVEITNAGLVSLNTSCHVLVVTYFSGENMQNSRGFAMMYAAISGPTIYVNATSKHYVVNTAEGHIRHPLNVKEEYTMRELSTFVYAPLDNIHNLERKTVVAYAGDSMQELCFDYLVAFEFHPSTGWINSTRVCAETDYVKWESDDIIMVVFISGAPPHGRGFHLVHSHELASLQSGVIKSLQNFGCYLRLPLYQCYALTEVYMNHILSRVCKKIPGKADNAQKYKV